MSSLEGKSLSSTYKDLLQVSNNNTGITNTSSYVEDGEGTPSILALSQSHVGINTQLQGITNGVLAVSGSSLFSGDITIQGNIFYADQGNATGLHTGSSIKLLDDVSMNSPLNGQVLTWNDTTSEYVPQTLDLGTESTPLSSSSIGELSDVYVTLSPANGQLLQYDSGIGQFTNKSTVTCDSIVVANTIETNKDVKVKNTGYAELYLDCTDGSGGGAVNFMSSGVTRGQIRYAHPANTMHVLVNGSESMTMISGGNVGIGKTSPTQKLDVNGNVQATQFIGDGSQLTNLPAAGGGPFTIVNHSYWSYNYNTGVAFPGQPVGSWLMYMYNDEWVYQKGIMRWANGTRFTSPFWFSPGTSVSGPQGKAQTGFIEDGYIGNGYTSTDDSIYTSNTSTAIWTEPNRVEYIPALNRTYISFSRNSIFDSSWGYGANSSGSSTVYTIWEVIYPRA